MGLVVLKLGSKAGAPVSFAGSRLVFHLSLQTIIGLFLYGVSFLLYAYLISKNDLGYIIPITSAFVYVLVFFASWLVFKESFTIMKTISIALIIGGIVMLGMSK